MQTERLGMTSAALYETVDALVEQSSTWIATLPFTGLFGTGDVESELPFKGLDSTGDKKVDLFSLIGYHVSEPRVNKFDPTKWPATKEGRSKLMRHLSLIAVAHSTKLNGDDRRGILKCWRCRPYEKKRCDVKSEGTHDKLGVALGLRKKTHHHDRKNNRPNGQQRKRATSTTRAISGAKICKVRLTLCFENEGKPNGYIYLSNKGCGQHRFHSQPRWNVLPIPRSALTKEHNDLIHAEGRANIGSTQGRLLVLECKQGFIAPSTYRTVIAVEPSRIFAKARTCLCKTRSQWESDYG